MSKPPKSPRRKSNEKLHEWRESATRNKIKQKLKSSKDALVRQDTNNTWKGCVDGRHFIYYTWNEKPFGLSLKDGKNPGEVLVRKCIHPDAKKHGVRRGCRILAIGEVFADSCKKDFTAENVMHTL